MSGEYGEWNFATLKPNVEIAELNSKRGILRNDKEKI